MEDIEAYKLKLVFDLTLDLTKIKQKYCNHLCVENFAEETLSKLLSAAGYNSAKNDDHTLVPLPVKSDAWLCMVMFIINHREDIESDFADFGGLSPLLEFVGREGDLDDG